MAAAPRKSLKNIERDKAKQTKHTEEDIQIIATPASFLIEVMYQPTMLRTDNAERYMDIVKNFDSAFCITDASTLTGLGTPYLY